MQQPTKFPRTKSVKTKFVRTKSLRNQDSPSQARLSAFALLLWGVFLVGGATLAAGAIDLGSAQAALDRGDPATALKEAAELLSQDPKSAPALLIQSSAHFMLGEIDKGRLELDRSLALDPTQRQGWLNRAGLAMAEEDFSAALSAFEKARDLDPGALDNELNLGATRLLLGQLDQASAHFEKYLARSPQRAESFYLVASNYAMGGYVAFALRHLHQAILLDERVRMQARRDPNFVQVEEHPRFLDLMRTDIFAMPSDAHRTARAFEGGYLEGNGPLLQSVLDALYGLGESFDRNVEVTPEWALIWGRMRIKLRQEGDRGVVELSAPAGNLTSLEWERLTKSLFDSIFVQLQKRK
ncbi:MAG: tetratricopeptide repeat protein [Thermoanaerobaculia bacterium]|nr:tetratricopeptide repeat protein [Thermoanaerobaculia bacterium]